jgi:FkbM family methyltransferase
MSVQVASSGLLPLIERGLYLDLPRRGVIHVGANDGAELQWYLDRGLTPILCFEPNPEAFRRGLSDWGGSSGIDYVRLALGSKTEALEMRVPLDGDDEKTSRYQPVVTLGHDWTAVPMGESLIVPVVRFDEWVTDDFRRQPYGTLVVDVQGMELEVLKGFGVYLQGFDYLCVELSEKPMYEGEPPAGEVIDWLREQGFRQETVTVEHGDVCFSRR